ncbi:hypothetical protein SynMITS9220_02123 [Synechococcus sp. MIT S9220]|nr:hypothetical protein SynMITS9220_02123 [Synechococcus sp. MIT S9220]
MSPSILPMPQSNDDAFDARFKLLTGRSKLGMLPAVIDCWT